MKLVSLTHSTPASPQVSANPQGRSSRLRHTLGARLVVTTALGLTLLGTPAAFAGDKQVHAGVACQQDGFTNASATTWRSTTGYLANNSGSTKTFICPAINDTLTTGVTAATINVGSHASCYFHTTNWATTMGAFSATQTNPNPGVGQLVLGSVTTPGGDIFGSYKFVCTLPNNAWILQYYINQK